MSTLVSMVRNLFLAACFFVLTVGIVSVPAASLADGQGKPLMIIRFDNDSVNYEENLDKAVKMALEKKPGVFFDLVAVSPDTKNKEKNKQYADDAKFIAKKISNQIKEDGVAEDMIRTTYQQNKLTKNNEIQIFVQ